MENIAVITITRQGFDLARRLKEALPSVRLYVSQKYLEASSQEAIPFDGNLKNLLAEIYPKHDAFIFIMAAGIVVRMIAPYIQDKKVDPAVVVMDLKGKFAISLVSGHLGGANELTQMIAEKTGAVAVITTGTDTMGTIAPDMIAKEIGGELEDFGPLKYVSGALVDGERVAVANLTGVRVQSLEGELKKNIVRCRSIGEILAADCKAAILITHELIPEEAQAKLPVHVVIRPKVLSVGLGCNRETPSDEFEESVFSILKQAHLSEKSIKTLATAELKRDEEGLLKFADKHGLPIEFWNKEELESVQIPNPSETVSKFVGVRGVAEPAAILSANGGKLIVEKVKQGNLTMAVAFISTGSARREG
jgi:cobalt-precorrin 5A hydrolase